MRKWTFATVCSLAMAFGCHSKQPPARPSTQPAASTAPTNRSESTSTSTMADSVVLFAVELRNLHRPDRMTSATFS